MILRWVLVAMVFVVISLKAMGLIATEALILEEVLSLGDLLIANEAFDLLTFYIFLRDFRMKRYTGKMQQ